MFFYKVLWWRPQVDNEFIEHEKKSNFEILKVMKSTSKTKFNHKLLSISFEDFNFIFYTWAFNTKIKFIV